MMIKTKIFTQVVVGYLLFLTRTMYAQTGINTIAPDTNAVLDLVSTNKGLLIPRLTDSQVTALEGVAPTPTNGLMIYNTDKNCIQVFTGILFECVTVDSRTDKTDDAWVDDASNDLVRLGTLSNGTDERPEGNEFVIKDNGNVGIGTDDPSSTAILELNSTSKAFIPPRMNSAQMNTITTIGAVVYNTDENCLYIRSDSGWKSTCSGLLLDLLNPFNTEFGSDRVAMATPRTYATEDNPITVTTPTLVELSFFAMIDDLTDKDGNSFIASDIDSQVTKLYYVDVYHSVDGGTTYTHLLRDIGGFNTAIGSGSGTESYIGGPFLLQGSKKLELTAGGSHTFQFVFKSFHVNTDTEGLSYILNPSIGSFGSFIQITKL